MKHPSEQTEESRPYPSFMPHNVGCVVSVHVTPLRGLALRDLQHDKMVAFVGILQGYSKDHGTGILSFRLQGFPEAIHIDTTRNKIEVMT